MCIRDSSTSLCVCARADISVTNTQTLLRADNVPATKRKRSNLSVLLPIRNSNMLYHYMSAKRYLLYAYTTHFGLDAITFPT